MKVNRRTFMVNSTVLGLLSLSKGVHSVFAARRSALPECKIRTLTGGPKHHFFGYYGICPWNKSGDYMVCLESDFQDHLPSTNEPAAIGLVDCATGKFTKVAETRAWNLQQGAMLHWNPLNPDTEIIYNDRRRDDIISVILDVKSAGKRTLPRAVSGVSHSGKYALSLTYGRLGRLRKTVGYTDAKDPNPNSPHPDNDGIFLMNLASGEYKLIVSIKQVYERLVKNHPELKERHMWFNHTVFNKNDTRFFFLARTMDTRGRLQTGMFTANPDGSELREVVPYGRRVSHFDWRNDKQILATFLLGGQKRKLVLFTDGEDDYQVIGEGFLQGDGHCSFSPDQNWIATDQNHSRTLQKSLLVYNLARKEGLVLGRFNMREKRFLGGPLRCDLHPRWNRTGDAVCFDALETVSGTRQLHVAHLSFA